MNGLLEILTNKQWMITPEFVHGILPTIQSNIGNHTTLGIEREKKSPMIMNSKGSDILREYQVTKDGTVRPVSTWEGGDILGKMQEPFVNVMPVDGPITRNGGACSYGSRDIRNWMMKAADNKYCQGHIITVNTPGGSAWAKNDFQQGIEYAHSRGQRVYAFIDGLCASAGMYLASLCDEVYVMNPNDQLGCVGVMAAFFTMKNGEKDLTSGETYREYYATKSINKNKEIRDIAENDDATLLIEELDKLEAEFRADMKTAFPNAKDEHLDGKIFPAEEVMGILCDGQMMLGDLISRVFDVASGVAQPIQRTAGRKITKKVTKQAPRAAAATSTEAKINMSNINNSINMKEQFPAIFALLGVEEMQVSEEGTFFNTELLGTLNAAIEAKQKEAADAKALADQLTAEKAELEQKVNDLNAQIETANSDHNAAIETLNGEHAAAIEEKDNQISALEQNKADMQAEIDAKGENITKLEGELQAAKDSFANAEKTIAERDQAISDLNAKVEELEKNPGEQLAAGASQNSNGQGVEADQVAVTRPVVNPSMTYEQMQEVWDGKK